MGEGVTSDLEEVDLHGAVAEVQHDGALSAEPVAQEGQAGELVAVPRRDVGARLQQVLTHVVTEVLQQRDLHTQRIKVRQVLAHVVMEVLRDLTHTVEYGQII